MQVKEVKAKIPAPSVKSRAFPHRSASLPMGSRNTKADSKKLPSTQESDSAPCPYCLPISGKDSDRALPVKGVRKEAAMISHKSLLRLTKSASIISPALDEKDTYIEN